MAVVGEAFAKCSFVVGIEDNYANAYAPTANG
jgi:hypothetical protein